MHVFMMGFFNLIKEVEFNFSINLNPKPFAS
jgi:hypothetical protein